jgi:photosystem II stability/assembly factor-like uncharacterized protein
MFTPEVGWVATVKQVLRTTDGGAHWSDVTPDQAREALRSTPLGSAVAFGGPDQAWLVPAVDAKESRVFRTSDGGRTWEASEPVPLGGWPGQLAFIDSQHGWLLLHLGGAAGSEAVRLLQSSDGGMHWNEVANANFGNQPAGSISAGCGKRGFTFVDARTGWLAGSCAGGPPFLYVSEDGGRAWQRQSLPPPAGYPVTFAGDIAVDPPIFVSRQEGVLPVSWTTDKGEPGEVLYVTHDGGQSWKATSFVPGRVNAILNRTDWFAVGDAKLGGDGKLYRTLDGGGTWTPLTTHGSLEGVQQFDFVNDKVGWARKRSVLLKTTDGGRTWTEQTLPGM